MPTDGTAPRGPAPVRMHPVHRARHRLRLRLDRPPAEGDIAAFADSLASVPGVRRAVLRPRTGSVILDTLADPDEVLAEIAARGIATIGRKPVPPPVGQIVQFGMLRADQTLKTRTEGALDLQTAIGLLLAAGSIVQLSRGRIAGPATTLAMTAYSLLTRLPSR